MMTAILRECVLLYNTVSAPLLHGLPLGAEMRHFPPGSAGDNNDLELRSIGSACLLFYVSTHG